MAKARAEIGEKDLHHWKLLVEFREALAGAIRTQDLDCSFQDPERVLQHADYLSLFLFALFNPVLRTMRALCSASHLQRVQHEICGEPVSLGSFSEAQHLVKLEHLEKVFGELSRQMQGQPNGSGPQWQRWFARDSSLFRALPRMSWALYGGGRAGHANNAVRLHLNLHILEDKPSRLKVTPGRLCERQVWEEQWEAGAGYVGDRYFGKNFQLFGRLQRRACHYVIRLIEEATINVLQDLALTPEDRKAGVVRQAWATLGKEEHRSVRLRVVWIESKNSALILVTNLPPEQLSAAEVSLLYRRRWQIECFFRWVKCLLGCRHWLAESYRGVTLQLYLALIASVLLQLFLGRRPNKRMLELLQLHQMGWASTTELMAAIERQQLRLRECQKNPA
ncbi:MAG TPA: IS4 family transposase [Verrucomicrobiae bacterium]|nr:IS4 family transposase [Verrucomicrobiae bacterium]